MIDIDISPEAVERLRTDLLAFEGAEYTRFGGATLTEKSASTLRALSAALTQSRAETAAAEARGMRRAAEIVIPMTPRISADMMQGRRDVRNAILAAIPQGDTTND